MFVGKFMLSHFTNHNGEKLYNTVYVLLSYVGIKIMEDTTTLHQKKNRKEEICGIIWNQ